VAIGSHAQHHRRLTTLSAADQRQELIGSRADLARRLPAPLDIVAFPHGDHDATVCEAAQAAGFRAGLTTSKGRNGAATDRYRVRRVSVHGHDGVLAVLWKAVTGEDLPAPWRALRAVRLWCRHRVRRR
jgi:peptidoglycan/xylan/chitin deacetylase (PgdA/CDA1 family)